MPKRKGPASTPKNPSDSSKENSKVLEKEKQVVSRKDRSSNQDEEKDVVESTVEDTVEDVRNIEIHEEGESSEEDRDSSEEDDLETESNEVLQQLNEIRKLLKQQQDENELLRKKIAEIGKKKKERSSSIEDTKRNERIVLVKPEVSDVPHSAKMRRFEEKHARINNDVDMTPLPYQNWNESYSSSEDELRDIHSLTQPNSRLKISVTPKIFSGKMDENVRTWIYQYEQCMIINRIPERFWTQLAFVSLSENAATWYATVFGGIDTSKQPWKEFVKKLRIAFEPSEYDSVLRTKLNELKQGSNIDAYVNEMRLILNQITDMSETDKVLSFIRGLKPATQSKVIFLKPKTLEAAIEIAIDYDFAKFRKNQLLMTSSENKKAKGRDKKVKVVNSNNKVVECYRCHKKGHYSRDCHVNLESKPESKQIDSKQIVSNDKNKLNKNGKLNELNVIESDVNDCFVITGKINNRDAKLLIDTGANYNHVKPSLLKELGIGLPNSKKEMIVTLGIEAKEVRVPERKVMLDVEVVNGKCKKEEFYILGINKDYDAILGFKWFKENHECAISKMKVKKKEKISKMMQKSRTSKERKFIAFVKLKDDSDCVKEPEWVDSLTKEYTEIITDELPNFHDDIKFEHKIELIENSVPKKKQYRLTPRELRIMNTQIEELLRKGLIRPSDSPFGAPVVFARKSDGSLRMCIDYRSLNRITKSNRYPLPNIQEIFDTIGRAKYFTKLDLKSGYHQFKMEVNSIQYTGFITPFGHYEWLVMPFGLSNAPSTFQSAMNEILKEYLNKIVVVYLDDIVIFSDTLEDHKKHVRMILDILKKNKLCIAKKKCDWVKNEIAYLGHRIGNGMISPDDQKIEIIKEWKRPVNMKEVQKFLGFANYYNKFIKNFAEIAKPLFLLTRKNVKFTWKVEHDNAFDNIKKELINYQKLICPDVNKPFVVYSDASDVAIGSVLMQKIDGVLHTVSMRSRCLKGSEINYSTYDKELLAIHDAFMNWRYYLDGNQCDFMTDHNPLTHLFKQDRLNSRQTRWMNDLWNQNFKIKYVKGKDNVVADALSRISINHISVVNMNEELEGLKDEYMNDMFFSKVWEILMLEENEKTDDLTKSKKRAYVKRFVIEDDRLYVKDDGKIRLCLPSGKLREKIINLHHDSLIGGHQGITRTYESLVDKFYFPRMRKIIERYVKTCVVCQRNKSHNLKPIGLLTPLEVPDQPWDTVSMDFVVKLPITKSGFDSMVVFVDKLTKRVIIRPCKTTDTAKDIARIYFDAIVREHGLSKSIVCDRDAKFTSKFWKAFTEILGIKMKMSTAFHPETDGQTERANRVIQDCLRHYVNFDQTNWDELLGPIEYVLNSTKQSSTSYTPFELDYGRNVLYPTDLMISNMNQKKKCDDRDVNKMIDSHRSKIRDAIDSLNTARMNQEIYANLKRREYVFNVGDKAFLRTKNYLSGEKKFRPKKKLAAKWAGPFDIIQKISETAYRLKLPPQWKIHDVFHVANLWPAQITDEFKMREKTQPPPDLIDGIEEYEVEAILKKRTNKNRGNRVEYLVQWRGHPDDVSWESEENVKNCQDLLDKFEGRNRTIVKETVLKEIIEPAKSTNTRSKTVLNDRLLHSNEDKTRKSTRKRKKNMKYED